MPSEIKIKHAKTLRDGIVKQLLKQQTVKAERVAADTILQARKDLEQTLYSAHESDEDGFAGAKVLGKVTRKNQTGKGVEITIRIWMADAQGKPHRVWHILQFGRRRFVQPRTSPPIQERVFTPRTQPHNLMAGAFMGYTGDTFRIPAGYEVPELPGREWYEIARDNRIEEVPKRWKGWQISDSRIVGP